MHDLDFGLPSFPYISWESHTQDYWLLIMDETSSLPGAVVGWYLINCNPSALRSQPKITLKFLSNPSLFLEVWGQYGVGCFQVLSLFLKELKIRATQIYKRSKRTLFVVQRGKQDWQQALRINVPQAPGLLSNLRQELWLRKSSILIDRLIYIFIFCECPSP